MKNFIKESMPYVIIVILVIIIRSFIITPVVVRGESMDNTLVDGEVLFLSKISYHIHDIKRFDVVVIRDKDDDLIIIVSDGVENSINNCDMFVKRVVDNLKSDIPEKLSNKLLEEAMKNYEEAFRLFEFCFKQLNDSQKRIISINEHLEAIANEGELFEE